MPNNQSRLNELVEVDFICVDANEEVRVFPSRLPFEQLVWHIDVRYDREGIPLDVDVTDAEYIIHSKGEADRYALLDIELKA